MQAKEENPKLVRKVNWITGLFVIAYHLFLLIALPIYFMHHTLSGSMIAASAILVFLAGIAVTAGYHRFYSHMSYKTNKAVEAVLLFFASMATQGSALRWSFEHRLHHAYVDTDNDPYSIKKGFWYAHILWLFDKQREIDKKVVSDLYRNPLVMFQHKYYVYCMLSTNILAFLTVGWLLNDYLGAFIFAWWARQFFSHHFAWFINSLAHTFGSQSFSKEHSAVDNYLISLVTYGEGYHNYHHTFANDYRNGVHWYQFDPTKWLIYLLHKCKLAHNLRKVNNYHIKEQIIIDHKNQLIARLKKSLNTQKDLIEENVSKLTDDLVSKLSQLRQLVDQYKQYKVKKDVSKDILKQLNVEIKSLQKSLKNDWKNLKSLAKNIMNYEVVQI